MCVLFVGGVVDNSEMDLEGNYLLVYYFEDIGGGYLCYWLYQVGKIVDGIVVYVVYGVLDMVDDEVGRIVDECVYVCCFEVEVEVFMY